VQLTHVAAAAVGRIAKRLPPACSGQFRGRRNAPCLSALRKRGISTTTLSLGGLSSVPLQLAWRILVDQKGRTVLATGGIFIAILLIFVELGFFVAVPQGGMLIYDHLRFDLLVCSNKYVFQSQSGQ